jgi:hypothetical protein
MLNGISDSRDTSVQQSEVIPRRGIFTGMPSPFPGMDPYLEDPGLWPDVHHGLISEIQAALNKQLRPKYFARVEDRVYLSDENDPGREYLIPDVQVMARPAERGAFVPVLVGSAAVTGADVVEPLEVTTQIDDEIHEAYINVVDRVDRSVVTVIEVLSPTNKAAGSAGRANYVEKRRDVMSSPTHLVEIDLLRTGVPIFARQKLPLHEYLVHVSRARDDGRRRATVWPIPLTHRLPVIPIPLRHGDPDASVDLQAVLATAFERGAYDLDLDYTAETVPPLKADLAEWSRRVTGA